MSIKYEVEVFENGNKEWRLDGKLHREDGPAIEGASGYKAWCLNGVWFSIEQFEVAKALIS